MVLCCSVARRAPSAAAAPRRLGCSDAYNRPSMSQSFHARPRQSFVSVCRTVHSTLRHTNPCLAHTVRVTRLARARLRLCAHARPPACIIVMYYAPANQSVPSVLSLPCRLSHLSSRQRLPLAVEPARHVLSVPPPCMDPSRPHVWIRFRHTCVRAAIRMPAVSDHVPSMSHSAPAYGHPSTPDALGQRLRWARAAPHYSIAPQQHTPTPSSATPMVLHVVGE